MNKNLFFSSFLFLFFTITLLSCAKSEKSNSPFYCSQEESLLRSSYPTEVELKLALTRAELFDSLQGQIDDTLCNNRVQLSAKLGIEKLQNLKLPILIERYCEEVQRTIRCTPLSSIHVLINANDNLLFEGEPTQLAQLSQLVLQQLEKEFQQEEGQLIAYSMQWDQASSPLLREKVLSQFIAAQLQFLRTVSQEKFNKPTCDLSKQELKRLGQMHPFALYFKDIIPPPQVLPSLPELPTSTPVTTPILSVEPDTIGVAL